MSPAAYFKVEGAKGGGIPSALWSYLLVLINRFNLNAGLSFIVVHTATKAFPV